MTAGDATARASQTGGTAPGAGTAAPGPSASIRGAPPSRWRRRAALAALVLPLGLVAAFWSQLDGTLHQKTPSQLLLDRRGRYLGEVPGADDTFGYWPLPAVLPDKLVAATLETEDRHFFDHPGVYAPSVARAAWQNARSRGIVSGASTVAMQLARLQHPRSRGLWAKAVEAAEALLLVRRHGHDRVLRQYLTLAPYGNRTRGVVRAARLYFDKPAEDLSWKQAAFLAALPQQPGRMSPWSEDGRSRALVRTRRILRQLHARGAFDANELKVALDSDLALVDRPARQPEAMHAVLAWSKELRGPAVIHTATLDLDVQRAAHRALTANLARLRAQGAGNTAGLVVDLEQGDVLAWVGSADYFDQEARGAIDYLTTKRSPGSTLKPFIYALALEQGTHTAATELADTPLELALPGGGLYAPENYSHSFLGPMLLRQALGNSRNIPALRVLSQVGVHRAVELFETAGVADVSRDPDAYGLSLALGSLHVTPEELATVYTALAHDGVTLPLRRFIDAPRRPGARLLRADVAGLVRHMLSDPEARRPGFSAGNPLEFDYAVAAKTGTSQGYRDAWTAAFSDRLLVVTWVGNHDWRRMNRTSGATAAAPAAHHILDTVMPTWAAWRPVADSFPLPANAVVRDVCALSGRVPGRGCTQTRSEAFLPGSEPTAGCPFHVEVAVDWRNGLRATPRCPSSAVVTRAMLDLPPAYAGWARRQRLEVAPTATSPLCPDDGTGPASVAISEPSRGARFLFDPDTPSALSTVRLAANVEPANEEVVWVVDGAPVAQVGWPHEVRWPLSPGRHTVRAVVARTGLASLPVTVVVED